MFSVGCHDNFSTVSGRAVFDFKLMFFVLPRFSVALLGLSLALLVGADALLGLVRFVRVNHR